MGIMLVVLVIYFTRVANLQANVDFDNGNLLPYADFITVYQFEQEESRLNSKINMLKAEYAADLNLYRTELNRINSSENLSQLEKREKIEYLEGIYTDKYFDRKIALIDQEKAVLNTLLEVKCQRFCVYQDLPDGI